MGLKKRRHMTTATRVVNKIAADRAKAEARTIRELRWTLSPTMLASYDDDTIMRMLTVPFEYVTEAQFLRPDEYDPTMVDDGSRILIARGVPRDE